MAKVKGDRSRTLSGRTITDEMADELADQIESDAPVTWIRKRPVGRPSLDGNGASPRVSFRVSKNLYEAAAQRAIEEERTVSALSREALERYLATES